MRGEEELVVAEGFGQQDGTGRGACKQTVELFIEVDVIDGFGGGHYAFSALVVEVERVD
jgi:hypothetical protein